ncbi:MAG: hypothetical protein JO308_11955, partial [Verrucomicrobia bacterium]|nr:hypothetical protein [Verrucomicrobiota bacterium]
QLSTSGPEMQLEQLYWTNATPMETAIAAVDHATTAFPTLESSVFTGTTGYFQEGQSSTLGVPKGNLQASALNTSVMAVAEANYGRTAEALRYVNFIATELDTEQPGALPELFDSPDYTYFQPFVSRAMVMQAWSSYGVEWPVIYHFLGVRPDVPARKLTVIPNLPDSWPSLSVDNLRVGDDTIAVTATRNGGQLTASVTGVREYHVQIGVVVPPGTSVQQVTLNGAGVSYQLQTTTRGQEVVVSAPRSGSLNLTVNVQ